MDKNLVLEKLEKAGLFGKGGAAYPTFKKWQGVSGKLHESRNLR